MKSNQHKKTKKIEKNCSCCWDGRQRIFKGTFWKKYWNKFVRKQNRKIELNE